MEFVLNMLENFVGKRENMGWCDSVKGEIRSDTV